MNIENLCFLAKIIIWNPIRGEEAILNIMDATQHPLEN